MSPELLEKSELEERARALSAALVEHRQLLQRDCRTRACAISTKFPLPPPTPGCHPSWGNLCQSTAWATAFVLLRAPSLSPWLEAVRCLGTAWYWAGVGGSQWGTSDQAAVEGTQLAAGVQAFLCQCLRGIIPAPCLLLVCSRVLLGRTRFTVSSQRNSSCWGEQEVTSALLVG